jgi:hypothetical protein
MADLAAPNIGAKIGTLSLVGYNPPLDQII